MSSANHNKNCKWVDEKNWEILKKYFPDATELSKCPITISCKECSQVPMNEHEDIFDPQTVTEKTFSSSYFLRNQLKQWKVL